MKWVAARRCREHKFERIADLSRKIEQLRKQKIAQEQGKSLAEITKE